MKSTSIFLRESVLEKRKRRPAHHQGHWNSHLACANEALEKKHQWNPLKRVTWSMVYTAFTERFHIHLSFLVTHRSMSLWIPFFWHFHRTLLGSSIAHKHKEPANGTCFTHRGVNQPLSAEKPTYVTGNASVCVNFLLMLDILSGCWSKTFQSRCPCRVILQFPDRKGRAKWSSQASKPRNGASNFNVPFGGWDAAPRYSTTRLRKGES